jgi:GNAT superfamily N-acetyltransferase
MKIRNATNKDITEIVSLGMRFFKEVPTWGQVPITEKYLKKLDIRLIWVAEENNQIVGYAICLPHKNDGSIIYNKNDKILRLDEIYIVPEFRNIGIGSQLLKVIDSYAKTQGYTKLFIYSSVKALDPVLKFYCDNGYTTWAVQFFKEIK